MYLLCLRWSHLISASSTWSWRWESSGLQLCRQRWEPQSQSKNISLLLLSSIFDDSSSLPGAIQIPIPHSGSDVLLSSPKHQPSLPEFQGGTKAPFLLSLYLPSKPRTETRTQRRSIWPPWTPSGSREWLWYPPLSSLLPYQTVLLKLTPLPQESMVTSMDFPNRGLASFLQISYSSPPVFPQNCAPVYDEALSFQTSQMLPTTRHPPGQVLRYPAPSLHSSLSKFSCSEANSFLVLETPALPCCSVYQIFTGSFFELSPGTCPKMTLVPGIPLPLPLRLAPMLALSLLPKSLI